MGYITIGIAQSLLEQETEPLRFEKLCSDLVSAIEGGVRILTTSSNYDRGRDGVSVGAGVDVIVLSSLTVDVDKKAIADARKLIKGLRNRQPDAVYFCSSQQFTEAKSDKIEDEMRKSLSLSQGFERVTVLSGLKISQLLSKQEGIVERYYPGELADIRRVLSDAPNAAEAEHALRLALSTTTSEDSATIREDVWRALLRLQLSRGAGTAKALAIAISNYLRLSAPISPPLLISHLNNLSKEGQVEVEKGVYSLTSLGDSEFQQDEARVAKGVLGGKEALVAAVEAQLQTTFTSGQRERMWHFVQEKLASLFYERGQEVLSQMATLLDVDAQGDQELKEFDLLAALADAAGRAFDHEEQREEVKTAVRDIVVQGDSEAVKWLTRAAYAFVCACAMGLEARTGSALEQVVGGTNLIFDTDVVLTYLSSDEPAHEGVVAIRERWRGLGGKILLADEVASEVAYHAWIAKIDSEHVPPHTLSTTLDRQVLSRNAFVRGFSRLVSDRKAEPKHWPKWIAEFRGKNKSDSSSTRRTLLHDHNFGVLPAPSGKYARLAEKVRVFLQDEKGKSNRGVPFDEHDEFVKRDKARRDAYLFASTVQIRERADEGDAGGTTFLLTSSSRFSRLEKEYRPDDESIVLTIPAVLYLLSMAPGRPLGLTALRGFLFDERWQERVSNFELMALRLVRGSREFDMPWSKRRTLLGRLKDRTRKIAVDRTKAGPKGNRVSESTVAEEWTTPTGKEQMLRELSAALDDVASDRRAEAALARAQDEIADLKRQLAIARDGSRG